MSLGWRSDHVLLQRDKNASWVILGGNIDAGMSDVDEFLLDPPSILSSHSAVYGRLVGSHCTFANNQSFYVCTGGFNQDGTALPLVQIIAPSFYDTWMYSGTGGIGWHTSIVYNNSILLFGMSYKSYCLGGKSCMDCPAVGLDQVVRLDLQSKMASIIPLQPLSKISPPNYMACTVSDSSDSILLYGGLGVKETTMWRVRLNELAYEPLSNNMPFEYGMACASVDRDMFVYGGCNDQVSSSVLWKANMDSFQITRFYSSFIGSASAKRCRPAMAIGSEGRLVVHGGFMKNSLRQDNRLHIFDTKDQYWVKSSDLTLQGTVTNDRIAPQPSSQANESSDDTANANRTRTIIFSVLGSVILLFMIIYFAWRRYRRRYVHLVDQEAKQSASTSAVHLVNDLEASKEENQTLQNSPAIMVQPSPVSSFSNRATLQRAETLSHFHNPHRITPFVLPLKTESNSSPVISRKEPRSITLRSKCGDDHLVRVPSICLPASFGIKPLDLEWDIVRSENNSMVSAPNRSDTLASNGSGRIIPTRVDSLTPQNPGTPPNRSDVYIMDPSSTEDPYQYTIVQPHEPMYQDEIRLNRGDICVISQVFEDRWAKGWNMTSMEMGFFPLVSCLLEKRDNVEDGQTEISPLNASKASDSDLVFGEEEYWTFGDGINDCLDPLEGFLENDTTI